MRIQSTILIQAWAYILNACLIDLCYTLQKSMYVENSSEDRSMIEKVFPELLSFHQRWIGK